MVFSSVPAYLDPPNWNQQQHLHQFPAAASTGGGGGGGGGGGEASHQLLAGLQGAARSEAAAMAAGAGGDGGPAPRPMISMTERARLAKMVPQPEQPLKCPRCDSTNTKFCYFNNYSLTQPRHFCKTCRRYWTRGGALRNVPVGGGCRRNKRSKSSSSGGGGGSSKSTGTASAAADRQAAGPSSSSAGCGGGGGVIPASITNHGQLSLLTSMHAFTSGSDYGAAPNLGLNFPGIPSVDAAEYHVANSSASAVGLDHWRLSQIQQFPLFGPVDPPQPQPLYHFNMDGGAAPSRVLPKVSGSSLITQLASVKMEDGNLPRHFLGLAGNEHYNWSNINAADDGGGGGSNAGWGTTDLSGFNSSSSGNNLL